MPDWKPHLQARLEALNLDPGRGPDAIEEICAHLDDRFHELLGRGVSEVEAVSLALDEMIGPTQPRTPRPLKPTSPGCPNPKRAVWLRCGFKSIFDDGRFAWRGLRKAQGFTAVALFTLALCLGANLTIFSIVNGVLLRPLPFPSPERLVVMYNSYPKMGRDRGDSSYMNYHTRRGQLPAFAEVAALREDAAVVGDAGTTEQVHVTRVSAEFFGTLGISPLLGRAFTDAEMTPTSDAVALLTHAFWREHFLSDPAIVGKTLRIDGVPKTIVGVLPANFLFLSSKARVYLPLSVTADTCRVENLHNNGVEVIGRLKPGVRLEQAQAQVDAHNATIGRTFPFAKEVTAAGFHTIVAPLHAEHVASIRPILLLLQAGGLLLLAIGLVNLVNLLLIRSSGRVKELAIRQSLGAGRRQILQHLMMEIFLLALGGAVLGLALSLTGGKLLGQLDLHQLPLSPEVAWNGRMALVTLLAASFTGLGMGIPVAWFHLRTPLASAIHAEGRGGTGNLAAQRLRHAFIVAQLGLAIVLLFGAGLLGLSLKRAMAVSPGFRPDHVLAGKLSLSKTAYSDDALRANCVERLVQAATQQPGVGLAGITTDIPVTGSHRPNVMTIIGYTPTPGAAPFLHEQYGVAGNYFAAMGIPLKEGRFLEPADSARPQRVCVIDEDFARTYWPGRSALGQRISDGSDTRSESEWFTVVGVVGAVKQTDLTDRKPARAIYFPYRYFAMETVFLVTRTTAASESLQRALQRMVRQVDPELPLYDLRSMEVRITDSLILRRSPALLSGIFATAAVLLAAIGTYGVLSFAVAQRRKEIGVRLALGAQPIQIQHQFLTLGLRLLAAGSGLGLLGAWVAGRAVQAILFDVPAIHLGTLGATVAIISGVALTACFLPARRASQVDPLVALRTE